MYARSDPNDFRKLFHKSTLKKVVEAWINSILLFITLPPHPQPRPLDINTGRSKKPTESKKPADKEEEDKEKEFKVVDELEGRPKQRS